MRILLLNTFPVWGGDEKWTINVGKGLQQRGHHTVISALPGSETEHQALKAGLHTFPFKIGPDIAFWKIPSFQKYLKRNEIEVVLCVQNRDVKIGALAARLAGIPAIFARQGLDTIKRRFDHKIPFTKYIDGIITNTKSIKELYGSYGWFRDDFIHVIYDGIELPAKLPVMDLHDQFGLKENSGVIVGAGRLVHQKRFDLLIKAAALAKEQELNWSVLIVGKGELQSKLQTMISDLGVEDIVKLVGFRSDVLSIMQASDIFVLSSDSEGMSNAIREAMAVGKPCVATHVFGVSELFQAGKAGIMVEKGNVNEIFNAVKSVFDSPDLRLNLEQNAAKLIRESFTMEAMIDQIEKLFMDQLAKSQLKPDSV